MRNMFLIFKMMGPQQNLNVLLLMFTRTHRRKLVFHRWRSECERPDMTMWSNIGLTNQSRSTILIPDKLITLHGDYCHIDSSLGWQINMKHHEHMICSLIKSKLKGLSWTKAEVETCACWSHPATSWTEGALTGCLKSTCDFSPRHTGTWKWVRFILWLQAEHASIIL